MVLKVVLDNEEWVDTNQIRDKSGKEDIVILEKIENGVSTTLLEL